MGEEDVRMAQEQPVEVDEEETSNSRTGNNDGAQKETREGVPAEKESSIRDQTPDFDNNYNVGPSLQELEHLVKHKRKDYKYYSWFYRVVLPNVVGKQAWKGQRTTVVGTTIASDSDEALALLILENSWMYWIHLYNNPHLKSVRGGGTQPMNDDQCEEGDAIREQSREGEAGEADDNTQSEESAKKKKEFVVRKLYTISGKKEKGKGDQKGWSNEGLLRMNELLLEVQKDRKDDRNKFDIAFRTSMIRQKWGKKTDRTDVQLTETVEVITGEWSD